MIGPLEVIPYLSDMRVYTLFISAVVFLFVKAVLICNRGARTISNPPVWQSAL